MVSHITKGHIDEEKTQRHHRPRARPSSLGVASKQYEKSVKGFFEIFNTQFDVEDGRLHHACDGCCASDKECQLKMQQALHNLPLSSHPQPPESGKWTKTGPCCDFYLIAFLFGWFSRITRISCAALRFETPTVSDLGEGFTSTDHDWAKVAGIRYANMRNMLESSSSRLAVIVFSIVYEPLRKLCSYFLHISWWVDRSRAPPLFDLVWEPTSIVHHVQQHYSDLLRGTSARLHIFRGMIKNVKNDKMTNMTNKQTNKL